MAPPTSLRTAGAPLLAVVFLAAWVAVPLGACHSDPDDEQTPQPDGGQLADAAQSDVASEADTGPQPDARPGSDADDDLAPPDCAAPVDAQRPDPDDTSPLDAAPDPGDGAALDGELDAGHPDIPCERPPPPTLTVNEVPASMNGSEPFTNTEGELEDYHLLLPPAGFTVDVLVAPEALDSLSLLAMGCGPAQAPDEEITQSERGWHWRVPPQSPLEAAHYVVCWADVQPSCGDPTPVRVELAVEVAAALPAELDPFVEPDTWLLLYHRDHWGFELGLAPDGGLALDSTEGGNGVPDLEEAMRAVGLYSDDPAAGAGDVEEDGAVGLSAVFQQRLLRSMLAQLRALYGADPDGTLGPDAVPIYFVLEGTPGAPDPMDFDPAGSFSMIGIGGRDPENDRNVGRALIDWNNQGQEDNASDWGLGIFTGTLIALFVDHEAAALILAPFVPQLGGTPLGEHDDDAEMFHPDFDPAAAQGDLAQRAALVDLATELLGRGLAALVAHEMGHSLGLVPYGPPPGGLFAGETLGEFVVGEATGAHINTEGFNVMQQGFTLQSAGLELLNANPTFNALNMAYLRRRLIVDPAAPRGQPWPAAAPEAP